ncbi:hypothetical protein [Vibrio phage VCPH]|nr:hypothetical protein [Vibrio phage VCPH]
MSASKMMPPHPARVQKLRDERRKRRGVMELLETPNNNQEVIKNFSTYEMGGLTLGTGTILTKNFWGTVLEREPVWLAYFGYRLIGYSQDKSIILQLKEEYAEITAK